MLWAIEPFSGMRGESGKGPFHPCALAIYEGRRRAGPPCRGVAQLVEQRSPKPQVGSSSLSAPAIFCAEARRTGPLPRPTPRNFEARWLGGAAGLVCCIQSVSRAKVFARHARNFCPTKGGSSSLSAPAIMISHEKERLEFEPLLFMRQDEVESRRLGAALRRRDALFMMPLSAFFMVWGPWLPSTANLRRQRRRDGAMCPVHGGHSWLARFLP